MAQRIEINGKIFTILFPDLIPAISKVDRKNLYDSIKSDGMILPVIVDEENGVIDGGNRLAIAAEIGLHAVPLDVRRGLSDRQKRRLALQLIKRRHCTAEQNRQLIAAELKEDPEQSNRTIAETVGVSHHTVADVREDLESTGQIAQLEEITGKDKKKRARLAHAPGSKSREERQREAAQKRIAAQTNGAAAREPGDDTEVEAAAKKEERKNKSGKPIFDDRTVSESIRKLAVLLNERAQKLDAKGKAWNNVRGRMDELITAWEEWQRDKR